MKRDDELHPSVSGNKWRKLKYNLQEARRQGHDTLLSYGGAYSNHLYALAAAGEAFGFRTIGIVRGQDFRERETPSLSFCRKKGMHLHYISREQYGRKAAPDFQETLQQAFGRYYAMPEGGSNALAVQGTAEMMPEIIDQLGFRPDYVCCPVGTGGTLAGLLRSAPPGVTVVGFSALKNGSFLRTEMETLLNPSGQPDPNAAVTLPDYRLIDTYAFGGYARFKPELLRFIREFELQTDVKLEQVYTGKMLYGIWDLARNGFFSPDAVVVAVHTGGLQGRLPALNNP